MNELINVKQENGELLVSARELHEGLGISERFNSWFDRMLKYGFEKDIDFTSVKSFTVVNNGARKEIDEYILKIDMAKEICMIQRNEKGKMFRKYFIECEKKLKEVSNKPILPTTYKEALQQLLIQVEENERLEQEKRQAIEDKNRLIHQGKLYNATELAKELGFKSANVLNKELENRKIQYKSNKTWVLTAQYSEEGYVSIKQNELENGKIIYDRKWTGKGRDFLLKLFNKLPQTA